MAIKTMTDGHLRNIPYTTTLNEELRKPESVNRSGFNPTLLFISSNFSISLSNFFKPSVKI